MKRRTFVKNTTLLSLTSLYSLESIWNNYLPEGEKFKIGLQLYTVRDEMAKNPKSTLKTLAEIGYTDLECAGYQEGKFYGFAREEFKILLEDLGLTMKSGHILTGAHAPKQKRTLTNDWEGACEDAAYMGQQHLVCPYLFDFERKSIDDYKRLADLFNQCGEVAKEYGISFSYHNHDFEFFQLDDEIPYDTLLKRTDHEVCNFELDLYWIIKAGKKPIEYFRNYPGRFILWHVKDIEDSEDQFFAEVGKGTIDWSEIFDQRALSGTRLYYVEQDICRHHLPMESIKMSYEYLKGKNHPSYGS
ncbi:MAG TPA: sugar phosphate isomerase/epimerase [Saprospiraceae bacterium]|nr:sugar phosphate isomerase/epimerase [Saprospiraceae bacterium]